MWLLAYWSEVVLRLNQREVPHIRLVQAENEGPFFPVLLLTDSDVNLYHRLKLANRPRFSRVCPVVRPFLPRHGTIGQACATFRAVGLSCIRTAPGPARKTHRHNLNSR